MKLHIEVTPEDIEDGMPGFGSSCPVALALRRSLDAYASYDGAESSVGEGALYVCHRPHPLPPLVQDFVRRFDAGRSVEPLSFDVEL